MERHPLISCFNIQEAGGKEERGIDQSSEVKVSKRGREAGRDERGQWLRWRGMEMKGGRGWKEGLSEHPSYRTLGVWCGCVCVYSSDFPLIELVLLSVQYSAFRLMVELIFLTLLCFPCVCVLVFV